MKKTTKILLGISGICGSVGIILLVAGLILGVSTAQFWDALSLDLGGILNGGSRNEKNLEALESLDDIHDPGLLSADWRTTSFSGVKSLSLEMDSGAVRMEAYDGDEIQVCVQRDDRRTQMEMDGSCLEITQKDRKFFRQTGKAMKIYIPEDFTFEDVDMELGATEFESDGFSAREISAQVGAGVLNIDGRITARESSWEVGMGVLNLSVLDCETTSLETGMGTAQVTLQGSQQDYELDGDLGMGSLEFGDFSGSLPGDHRVNEGADRMVRASCGMGEVEIDFTE
ncbi:MAG TPA: DUF4097 family beta strand repeat protein [Candidatus Pullilachnospira intestinigallinarum]|nr:DUF4097 family beta strand repeat protein [Candidatus Pullilachnospira intestinigallinarum]